MISIALFAPPLLLAGCAGSSSCGDGAITPSQAQGCNQAVEVDLGMLFADEAREIDQRFAVENRTSAPATIERVSHSCTCAGAKVDATTLAPGASCNLVLSVNLAGRMGSQHFTATLHLSSGQVWNYGLRLTILPRVRFEPDEPHFQVVEPGGSYVQAVSVQLVPDSDHVIPRICALSPDSQELAIADSPAGSPHAGATRRDYSLRLQPLANPGTHVASLNVRYTHNGIEHETRIPVRWIIREAFEALPRRLFVMNSTQDDKSISSRVSLKRCDGAAFVVRAVRTDGPHLVCAVPQGVRATTHELQVSAEIAASERSFTSEICIDTDHPTQPLVRIPFTYFSPRRSSGEAQQEPSSKGDPS